ncbi:hypothetical protein LOCC1_G003359 [Lachnellula occidentalis]|uniref:BTB domain-containing protein n=1 Tax=Lachnellula occidentalis TaxID=215460 RepID=A0A8H8RYU4_9HELO|nr:hypothetical protein LOCC1_G003359 [Lachnellula occidentalis]
MHHFVQHFPSRFPAPMTPPPLNPPRPESTLNPSQDADASQSAPALVPAKKVNKRTRKTRPKFRDSHAMVTINVTHAGEKGPTKFVVHREFICHYSPYFDAAFNGDFIEGQTQTLDLNDFWPTIFELFIDWIYTQNLCDLRGKALAVRWMVPLWLAAEMFLVPELQNQTLELMNTELCRLRKNPATDVIQYLYDNSTEECSLRRFIVATCHASFGVLEKDTEYPTEFLIDLINYGRSPVWFPLSPDTMKRFLVKSDTGSASVFRAVGSHKSEPISTASAAVA